MIRKLEKSDRKLYVEMATEFYSSDAVLHSVPEENFQKTVDEALSSDTYAEIYLFEHEGKTAGYGLTARTFSQEAGGYVVWIEEIYIREEYRSKGIGKEFFSFLHNKEKSAARLRLEVEEENVRAVSLYEELGYEKLDYIQMIKEQSCKKSE